MKPWSIWRRALLWSMPALATGLFMDSWGANTLAWGFVVLAIIIAVVGVVIWLIPPTPFPPVLAHLIVIAGYAFGSALAGSWWVDYRLHTLSLQLQEQLRSLPPGTAVVSIPFASTHRLIFDHADVGIYMDEQDGITFVIDDHREMLLSRHYVTANEIRYIVD